MYITTNPKSHFSSSKPNAVPIRLLTAKEFKGDSSALSAETTAWAKATDFSGKSGQTCLIPDQSGSLAEVLFGLGSGDEERHALSHARLARTLPKGNYILEAGEKNSQLAELAWAMGGYSFDRYRKREQPVPKLVVEKDPTVEHTAQAVFFTRDLINTPANDMGPDALEKAFRKLADHHKADICVIKGDDLLKMNFPMVHAVGRASDQAPRILDLSWGKKSDPTVTLVGKGVTFDTGGLNIKPGGSMALMKKDMGGAANVMGLAHLIMAEKLPVRLRLIVGAVENAISGNAFRPGDILPSRKGITVEIGNTDAEGRLVLGDCLALADEDSPEIMIDMATLTGAARVALGPDLPPFYTNDDTFASELEKSAQKVSDPLWRMPLWSPYQSMLSSKIADVNHISSGGFAGSVTAALFLSRFVEKAESWVHLDIFGWVPTEKPWAMVGGEAQCIRALYDTLQNRFKK